MIDGKDTAWSTFGYSNAALGGGKKGVGLLFDLGEARAVGRIEVRTPGPGWVAEWRTAESKGSTADALQDRSVVHGARPGRLRAGGHIALLAALDHPARRLGNGDATPIGPGFRSSLSTLARV